MLFGTADILCIDKDKKVLAVIDITKDESKFIFHTQGQLLHTH